MLDVCSAGEGTQDLKHSRQSLYQLSQQLQPLLCLLAVHHPLLVSKVVPITNLGGATAGPALAAAPPDGGIMGHWEVWWGVWVCEDSSTEGLPVPQTFLGTLTCPLLISGA